VVIRIYRGTQFKEILSRIPLRVDHYDRLGEQTSMDYNHLENRLAYCEQIQVPGCPNPYGGSQSIKRIARPNGIIKRRILPVRGGREDLAVEGT